MEFIILIIVLALLMADGKKRADEDGPGRSY